MNRLVLTAFVSFTLVAGCSSSSSTKTTSSTTKTDGGAGNSATRSKPKSAPKVGALKAQGGAKPPANAVSKGAQTKPQAGTLVVPIENVEVFVFPFDVTGSGTNQDVQYAHVDQASTYLWSTGPVTCDDGSTDDSGTFLMEVKPDGSGTYIFALPNCPSSDLFGCDFDASGTETSCGACAMQDQDVVCVAQ